MSVLVWDGTTLAADKQMTNGGLIQICSKIFRIGKDLIGFTGDYDYGMGMKHWLENGADPDSFPDNQKDKDGWVGALVIKHDGRVLKYDRCPHPYDLSQNRFVCLGSGRDFAYGAMEMGADAVRAVEVACKYEASCGCGIETLALNNGKS